MSSLFRVPECAETRVKISMCIEHRHHCQMCGQPTSAGGHFVGGSRPDARTICDPTARNAYLALIRDASSPGRRLREVSGGS